MKKDNELNLYHHAISKVLSSTDKKNAIHLFKNSLDYNVLCQLTDGLSSSVKPLNFTIYGNSLPKKIEELGKSDTLYKPESIEGEFKWILLSIRKYSKELSLFIILKKEFEKNFLLGKYDKAESILESILNETGYSLWYIESKFLLLEYQNKSEEQKEFLSEINQSNKNGMIGTIAHFLSCRTERNLSPYKYDSDINSIFRENKNSQENDNRKYCLFRLNFYENYEFRDYSAIVLFENCNSIIDRYLLLKDILKVLSFDKKYKEFIYSKARYIYRKINDTNLLPLLYLSDSKTFNKEYYQEKYVRVLDLYCSGLYEEAIIECTDYLLNNSAIFDLLIIHAKCHISLKIKLTKITDEQNSLLNQMSTKIFDLISSSTIRKDLLYNLYQINKNILSFDIASGLDYFLKEELNLKVTDKLKFISLNHFDPYFSSLYFTSNESDEYLNFALERFPNSISIKHRIKYLNSELTDGAEISDELFSIDKAKILFNQEKYSDSIFEWALIVKKFKDNAPIIQTSLKYWFECLIKQEDYNESIQLFVVNYLSNPNSISKINATDLLELLRKIRYKGVKRSIDLPIFVSLNSDDDTEKSFILEQYCKIFNKTKPSELFDLNLDSDKIKNEIFYNIVCSSETLKHSIYINTTIERLSERLNIINHLIEISPEKNKIYQEELNLISNELIIYEGTQKLEESKIYANDQAIINYELDEIEGLFSRYKTIYKLSLKDKKILVISQNSYALFKFDGKEKYNEPEVKYTDSALLEVFHELFDSILDKYLFSKFGIVAYLSTRIRHGVLLGEIRPEIEKQNLILNRIGNTNNYEESKFWNQRFYNLNLEQKNKLHDILTKFSLKIDTLIEDIIKQRIQIRKDGKNEKGLFNYEFEKTELYSYAIDLATETDVKLFSQKVIDLIWKRTDANLEVIRDYINGEIKNKFSEELNNLDMELRSSFSNQQLPQIFTSLIECTTIIENKINKISSWFKRSGSSIDDFNIEKVFNIVWNNTERCYPKIFASCNIKLQMNPKIKSNYYIDFTDLFRIMLDNMFKYGLVKEGKKQFYFECYNEDENMICSFANYIESGTLDIPLKSTDGQLIIDTKKLISESKSGISKAIKIVKFDLDNEDNFIRVVTDEPEKFVIETSININKLIRYETDSNS